METTKAMILDWESKIRNNDKKKLSSSYFCYDDAQNEKEAIVLFRYVFEKVLHWTPEDIRNNISMEIIEKLKLKKAYNQIIFPRELSRRSDCFYLAKKCYPDQIHGLNQDDIWRMEYMKVLDNKYEKFPKNYFSEAAGDLRAKVFLLYQLETQAKFRNKEEMYMFFADTPQAIKFLKSVKLKTPLDLLYASPLEYMHESLPESQKDEFLFKFAEFTQMDKKLKGKSIPEINTYLAKSKNKDSQLEENE